MMRKMAGLLVVVAVLAGAAGAALGCGGGNSSTAAVAPGSGGANAGENLNQRIDALKKQALTVEVIDNGKSGVKWSQDGKGSWRMDNSDSSSYTIYNARQNKGWRVDGNTATEIDPGLLQGYEAGGPLLLLSAYSSYANLPHTGGSSDSWQWSVPGLGSLSIEFKGPNGLISKVVSQGTNEGSQTLEFNYSNVGNVPASTFELPSGVTVTSTPGGMGGGSSTGALP